MNKIFIKKKSSNGEKNRKHARTDGYCKWKDGNSEKESKVNGEN